MQVRCRSPNSMMDLGSVGSSAVRFTNVVFLNGQGIPVSACRSTQAREIRF